MLGSIRGLEELAADPAVVFMNQPPDVRERPGDQTVTTVSNQRERPTDITSYGGLLVNLDQSSAGMDA